MPANIRNYLELERFGIHILTWLAWCPLVTVPGNTARCPHRRPPDRCYCWPDWCSYRQGASIPSGVSGYHSLSVELTEELSVEQPQTLLGFFFSSNTLCIYMYTINHVSFNTLFILNCKQHVHVHVYVHNMYCTSHFTHSHLEISISVIVYG